MITLALAVLLACPSPGDAEDACRRRAAQIAALPAAPTVTARLTAARYVVAHPAGPMDAETRARFEWACEALGHPLTKGAAR